MKSIKEKFLKSFYEIYKITSALTLIIFLPTAALSEKLTHDQIDDLFAHGKILSISQMGKSAGAHYHITLDDKFHFCRVYNRSDTPNNGGEPRPSVICYRFSE